MDVTLGPADLADGELRSYEIGARYVLVASCAGGLHALDDTCNHAGCLLSGGWLEGREVVCPCHEYRFDVTTGLNVTVPRLAHDQAVFALRVVEGALVVSLPEPVASARR